MYDFWYKDTLYLDHFTPYMVKFFQAAGGSAPPHPPYAIYILVIGPHFFQVTSLALGLSSNFTPWP